MTKEFFDKLVKAMNENPRDLSFEKQKYMIDGEEVIVQRILPDDGFIDDDKDLPGFVGMMNGGQSDLAENAKSIVRNSNK